MEGVRLGKENEDVLLFADDMVLLADSAKKLQMNLKKLDEILTTWEMKMNWPKHFRFHVEDRSDEGGKRERTLLHGS